MIELNLNLRPDKNSKVMKTGKALLGVAAGMAAGAVLGMLFVPERKSGKRLSEKELSQALDEKLNEKFDELVQAIVKKQKSS